MSESIASKNRRCWASSATSTKTRIKSSRYDSPSCRQRPRIVCISDDTAPEPPLQFEQSVGDEIIGHGLAVIRLYQK